jgi:hypothetical protein
MPDEPHITELLRELKARGRKYATDPSSVPPLPWVFPRSVSDPDDPTLAAEVVAVTAITPSRSAGPQLWLVRGKLRVKGSEPLRLTQLSIEHLLDPMAEVTSVVVHGLQVARLRDRVAAYLAIAAEAIAILYDTPKAERRAKQVARAAKQARRVGRRGKGEAFYCGIAREALELYKEGEGSRTVIRDLATAHRCGYSTVRDWIARARELGFLAPARKGHQQWLPGPALNRKETSNDA